MADRQIYIGNNILKIKADSKDIQASFDEREVALSVREDAASKQEYSLKVLAAQLTELQRQPLAEAEAKLALVARRLEESRERERALKARAERAERLPILLSKLRKELRQQLPDAVLELLPKQSLSYEMGGF